jgi:hypothetical protein
MSLSDEARRIVDEARAAYGPTGEDRARVGASLPLKLAGGTATAGLLAGKGVALGLAALVVVGGAGAGYWWSRSGTRPAAGGSGSAGAPPVAASVEQPDVPEATPPATERTAEPPARAVRNRAPTIRAAVVKSSTPEPGPNVAGEIALLNQAQRALAGREPERALQLLDRHAREFPRGSLTEERTAARIMALCALGNVTTARAEAAVFVRQSPGSPLAERVRASCGSELLPVSPNGER